MDDGSRNLRPAWAWHPASPAAFAAVFGVVMGTATVGWDAGFFLILVLISAWVTGVLHERYGLRR